MVKSLSKRIETAIDENKVSEEEKEAAKSVVVKLKAVA